MTTIQNYFRSNHEETLRQHIGELVNLIYAEASQTQLHVFTEEFIAKLIKEDEKDILHAEVYVAPIDDPEMQRLILIFKQLDKKGKKSVIQYAEYFLEIQRREKRISKKNKKLELR